MRSSISARMRLAAPESESATDWPSHAGQAIDSARLRARSSAVRGPPSSTTPNSKRARQHDHERQPAEQPATGAPGPRGPTRRGRVATGRSGRRGGGHEPSPPERSATRPRWRRCRSRSARGSRRRCTSGRRPPRGDQVGLGHLDHAVVDGRQAAVVERPATRRRAGRRSRAPRRARRRRRRSPRWRRRRRGAPRRRRRARDAPRTQGWHQVAKKLTTTHWPRWSSMSKLPPSSVSPASAGATLPMSGLSARRSVAGSRVASTPTNATASSATTTETTRPVRLRPATGRRRRPRCPAVRRLTGPTSASSTASVTCPPRCARGSRRCGRRRPSPSLRSSPWRAGVAGLAGAGRQPRRPAIGIIGSRAAASGRGADTGSIGLRRAGRGRRRARCRAP